MHTQRMIQNKMYWTFNKSHAIGGGTPLPCLPPLIAVSHLHLTSLDAPELGPGMILGPSGPSVSASTGPTNVYPSTPASGSNSRSRSQSFSTSSVSRRSSSNLAAPIPMGGHSSNVGAVAGSIAAISVLIAALLFYL
jgi:hypothetical protein